MNKLHHLTILLCAVACMTACSDKNYYEENYYNTPVEEESPQPVPTLEELDMLAEANCYGTFGNQLAPSWIFMANNIGQYYGGDCPLVFNDDIIGLEFTNPGEGREMTLRMKESAINEESVLRFRLPEDETVGLCYPVVWNYDALRENMNEKKVTMAWEVEIDGKFVGEYIRTFRCLPATYFNTNLILNANATLDEGCQLKDLNWGEIPHWIVPDTTPEGESVENLFFDTSAFLAGWVEETHPLIDQLKREAIDAGAISKFTGTQSGDEGIIAQLKALWYVLEKRHFTYTMYGKPLDGQYVRFLDEVIGRRQGYCAEVAHTLASLCQSIGLETAFASVPGHVYIVVKDCEGDWSIPVEGTALGTQQLCPFLDLSAPVEEQIAESSRHFDAMMEYASNKWDIALQELTNGTLQYSFHPITPLLHHVGSMGHGASVSRTAGQEKVKFVKNRIKSPAIDKQVMENLPLQTDK